jgi:hypothetical protein
MSFIHEADYWQRDSEGAIPEGLSLLMAAHAARYVRNPNQRAYT